MLCWCFICGVFRCGLRIVLRWFAFCNLPTCALTNAICSVNVLHSTRLHTAFCSFVLEPFVLCSPLVCILFAAGLRYVLCIYYICSVAPCVLFACNQLSVRLRTVLYPFALCSLCFLRTAPFTFALCFLNVYILFICVLLVCALFSARLQSDMYPFAFCPPAHLRSAIYPFAI